MKDDRDKAIFNFMRCSDIKLNIASRYVGDVLQPKISIFIGKQMIPFNVYVRYQSTKGLNGIKRGRKAEFML